MQTVIECIPKHSNIEAYRGHSYSNHHSYCKIKNTKEMWEVTFLAVTFLWTNLAHKLVFYLLDYYSMEVE